MLGIVVKSAFCACAFLLALGVSPPLGYAQYDGAWRLCLNRESRFSLEDVLFGCTSIAERNETPDNVVRALHLAGAALHKAGQTAAALEQYNKAVNAFPEVGEAYFNRAGYHHAAGRLDQALSDYDKIIALGGPSAPDAHFWRGTVRIARKETRDGLADLDKAIELAKDFPRPNYYAERAWVHYSLGDWDKALADFSTFVEWNPQDPEAVRNRGLALQAKGDFRQAASAFDKAIELKVDYVEARLDRAYSLVMLGQANRALSELNSIVAKEPNRARAHSILASAFAAKGDARGALDHHGKAIAIEPESVEYKRARGFFLFNQGDFRAAAADFAATPRVQTRYDGYVALFHHLARARSGDANAAGTLQAEASHFDPNSWPFPVVQLFLGQRSAAEVVKSAPGSNERCEAHFFVGEWHLLQANRVAAKADLDIAAKTCPKSFDEYAAAVAELKRLAGR